MKMMTKKCMAKKNRQIKRMMMTKVAPTKKERQTIKLESQSLRVKLSVLSERNGDRKSR